MARFATQRGLDRLVNFSDATVAIAVTVLVLPLTELAGQGHRGGVGAFLADHVSVISAFLISFLMIAVIWTEHHRLFEALVSYDGPLVVFNFVWLLAIVAIPFSTAISQDRVHDRLSSALYLGNLLVAFVALAAMHLVARYDPDVVDPGRRGTFRVGPSIVFPAICAVALIIAIAVPAIGRFAVFLLVLAEPVWLAIQRIVVPDDAR